MKKERELIALGRTKLSAEAMARRLDLPLKALFRIAKRLGVSIGRKPKTR
jgi:hypothetical protein